MKTAGNQLLIFEGASAGRYQLRSRPSEQRHDIEWREPRCGLRSSPEDEGLGRGRGKNRQLTPALRVTAIIDEGPTAFGFVAWVRRILPRLRVLLARPLLRIRYGSPLRGYSRNTCRWTAWVDLPTGQTRQGEPSEHRVTGVTMKPAQQPVRRGHREMARQCERVKAALSATPSCRNGLDAIKSVLP